MNRWIPVALLVAGLASGCGQGASKEQCKQLLDHLVDLEVKKAGATASETVKADLAKQKAAVTEAKSAEFLSECMDKTAKERVVCALAAPDLDAVAKCDNVGDETTK